MKRTVFCSLATQQHRILVLQLAQSVRAWVQLSKTSAKKPCVVARDSNPSVRDTEAGGSLGVCWQGSLVESVSFRLRERSRLTKQNGRGTRETVDPWLS